MNQRSVLLGETLLINWGHDFLQKDLSAKWFIEIGLTIRWWNIFFQENVFENAICNMVAIIC